MAKLVIVSLFLSLVTLGFFKTSMCAESNKIAQEVPAKRSSWFTHPLPEKRELLPFHLYFQRPFSQEEFKKICLGHMPADMDDRWFIFFENDWLYFHRSWTGYCMYQLRFEQQGLSYHVKEAWVNRDINQYTCDDAEWDIWQLRGLFSHYFDAKFN